jgi:arabinofuranosyltransferase
MSRWINAPGWLLAASLLASQLWLFREFAIDDAFITFRYVRQFVAGNGLVFNIGERVEGYSNFLWVMLLALPHAMGVEPMTAARALGVILSAGTLLVTYQLARSAPYPVLAPLMLAACAPFTAWTMGGLETALFAFLLVASAFAFIREEERGHGAASGLLFGLLALARPEGIIFFGLAAGIRIWRIFLSRNEPPAGLPRRDGLRLAGFCLVFVPHFVWRLSYYGWPLPNTVYAKAMGLHPRALIEGAHYLFEGMTAIGGAWFLAVPIALIVIKRRSFRYDFLLACVAAYGLFVLIGGGDWMPLQRFWAHILPLLIALAHAGLMALAALIAPGRPGPVGVGLALVQTAFLYLGALDAHLVHGIGQPAIPQGPTMTDYLRAHWRPGDVLAVTDAGGLAYALPLEACVVDMFGLTDAHIAHLQPWFPSGLFGRGDGFGKWDVDYVLAQNPRFIQVHVIAQAPNGTFIVDNTSNRLLVNDPRFRARYRQVAATPELQGLFERIR